jgi:integrase
MKTKAKLTDAFVAGLAMAPGSKSDHTWYDPDLPLFGCRVRNGKPSWTFGPYRVGGRQGRVNIGSVTAIKAKDARATATKLYAQTKLGHDPKAEKRAASLAARDEIRFGEAVGLYLVRQQARLRPRSLIEAKRHLEVHARPLHAMALVKVDRRTVAALLAKIGASNGPIAANNVRRDLSAFFAWCCREGLTDLNPAAHTNRFASRSRDHVLTDDELRAIWRATEAADDPYSAIVRLLMLIGVRRQEIGGLAWSEIDLDAGTITLPPARTKNARAFVIPLPAPAIAILRAQPRGDDDHVFAACGFRGWSRGKLALDKRSETSGWRLHDLRRVVSTRLHEDLLQPPHLIEAILGHVQPGIAATYNRADYLIERRRVLGLWAEHLLALVEDRPAKVVALLRP